MRRARQVTIPDEPIPAEIFDKLSEHAFRSALWGVENYGDNTMKVRQKLTRKGFPERKLRRLDKDGTVSECDIISETVERLVESRLVDDDQLARDLFDSQISAGRSLNAAKNKMRQRLFPPEMIESLAEEYEQGESSAEEQEEALDMAAQRLVLLPSFLRLDPYKRKGKLLRSLVGKGFEMGEVFEWADRNGELFEQH